MSERPVEDKTEEENVNLLDVILLVVKLALVVHELDKGRLNVATLKGGGLNEVGVVLVGEGLHVLGVDLRLREMKKGRSGRRR